MIPERLNFEVTGNREDAVRDEHEETMIAGQSNKELAEVVITGSRKERNSVITLM